MKIRGWGASDVGRKREHNEDSFLCDDTLGLYAVADGMGGHLGGERASRMAVEIVASRIATAAREDSSGGGDRPDLATTLRRAVGEADRAIYDSALVDPAVAGMGTTLTVLLFADRRAHVTHVGDSRAYL